MRICFFVLVGLILVIDTSFSQQKYLSELRLKDKTFFLIDSSFTPEKEKSPVLAGVASFIVPGLALGQLINGQYLNFALRLFTTGIGVLIIVNYPPVISMGGGGGHSSPWTAVGAIIIAANWLSSVVDAVIYAANENRRIKIYNRYHIVPKPYQIGIGYDRQGIKLNAVLNF